MRQPRSGWTQTTQGWWRALRNLTSPWKHIQHLYPCYRALSTVNLVPMCLPHPSISAALSSSCVCPENVYMPTSKCYEKVAWNSNILISHWPAKHLLDASLRANFCWYPLLLWRNVINASYSRILNTWIQCKDYLYCLKRSICWISEAFSPVFAVLRLMLHSAF